MKGCLLQQPNRCCRDDCRSGESKSVSILEGEDPRFGRAFEYLVYALIIVTMIEVTLETLPNLPNNWKVALAGLEVAVVTIFTAEYLLRIFAAPRPLGYILSFWGLVDLVAIAPFYLSLGLDLRALRALRLLRLFRMLKAFRRAGDRIVDAFIRVRGVSNLWRICPHDALF